MQLWHLQALIRRSDNATALALARYPQAPLEKVAFDLSPEAETCLHRISEIMYSRDGKWCTACRLAVEPDGRTTSSSITIRPTASPATLTMGATSTISIATRPRRTVAEPSHVAADFATFFHRDDASTALGTD
jgi:hypothetical protein